MFRFSIRELMLITLVVGLTIGWLLDHLQMSRVVANAKVWRTSAGALEFMLGDLGWKVEFDLKRDKILVFRKDDRSKYFEMPATYHEPSPEQP